MVGWRVSAYSGSGWYDGYIFRYRKMGAKDCFQVCYDDDEGEEWFEYPEPSIVFNASQPGTARVGQAQVQMALDMYGI